MAVEINFEEGELRSIAIIPDIQPSLPESQKDTRPFGDDEVERTDAKFYIEAANPRDPTIKPNNELIAWVAGLAIVASLFGVVKGCGGHEDKIAGHDIPAATKNPGQNARSLDCEFSDASKTITLRESNPLVQYGGIDASVAVRWIAGSRKAREKCAGEALGEVTARNVRNGLPGTFLPEDLPFKVPKSVRLVRVP